MNKKGGEGAIESGGIFAPLCTASVIKYGVTLLPHDNDCDIIRYSGMFQTPEYSSQRRIRDVSRAYVVSL